MTLRDVCAAGLGDAALICDDVSVDSEGLVKAIDQLSRELSPYRSVMVVSSEAHTVIAALAACECIGIPIWIAHYFLESEAIDRLAATHGIEVCVRNGLRTSPIVPKGPPAEIGTFAVHLMTSGSTGEPKVARYDLATLTARVNSRPALNDRWLLTYPPSTFAGLQVVLTALLSRATLVSYSAPSVSVLAAAIGKHGITSVSATPTFWRAFLLSSTDASSDVTVRQVTMGGEIVDQTLLDRLRARFPEARIVHIYASTEAGALFSVKDGRAGFPAHWLATGIDGVGLRIRDGMLEVRSPRRMRSYVSAHTSPLTEDGWLMTGDLVDVEEERVRFVGRSDQIVNVGGSKVSVAAVERFLLAISGVADARVTGVRSPISGAVLKAEVVSQSEFDPAQLRQHVSETCRAGLPAHMVPRIITIVASLTTSAAGKKAPGVA